MKEITLSTGKKIIVSLTEEIKAGDEYYSVFHKEVMTCYNENHAKGLARLRGTDTEGFKVIKIYKLTGKPIKVGDTIRSKNDPTYIGVCTKISIPKSRTAIKEDIRFPYLDNSDIPCGTTLDQWEAVILKS